MRPTPIPPKPGQESVWDYPRPARWEDINKQIDDELVTPQAGNFYAV